MRDHLTVKPHSIYHLREGALANIRTILTKCIPLSDSEQTDGGQGRMDTFPRSWISDGFELGAVGDCARGSQKATGCYSEPV